MVLMIDRIHLNCDTIVLMIEREYIYDTGTHD